MTKKVELTPQVERLTKAYLQGTKQDFSDVVNKALKEYIIHQLDSKDAKKLLQQTDHENYDLSELFGNLHSWMEQ
jgi:superfamily II helicase